MFPRYILIAALCWQAACGGPLDVDLEIIGHGGSGFSWPSAGVPPNTIESVRRGVDAYGADAVEVDVQLTRDLVPVLYHDRRLEAATDCTGCVGDYTVDELGGCRYRQDLLAWPGGAPPLATLREVLAWNAKRTKPVRFYLDVRNDSVCRETRVPADRYAEILLDELERHGLAAFTSVQTGQVSLLEALRARSGGVRLLFKALPRTDGDVDFAIAFGGMVVTWNEISAGEVRRLRERKVFVVITGVKSQVGVRYVADLEPDAVMTDDIRAARAVLGR